MNMAKKSIDAIVHPTAQTIFFTSAGTGEVKTLNPYETTVICDTSGFTGTVKLPAVKEAEGMTFNIILRTAGNNLTITSAGGGTYPEAEAWADITLTANDNYAILYSDGQRWMTLASATS